MFDIPPKLNELLMYKLERAIFNEMSLVVYFGSLTVNIAIGTSRDSRVEVFISHLEIFDRPQYPYNSNVPGANLHNTFDVPWNSVCLHPYC